MYPRWQIDAPNAPLRPRSSGAGKPPASRIEFDAAQQALELETQLNAELDGASWAVLASAPQDALWTDWLYRNLNGYPVPPTLVDSVTSHGLPRRDCVSIFPDRRDPQHPRHYPRALQKSGYLVVVCSPDSARCAEVDEKLRVFKNAGGEERIIALVVEGQPEGALEKAPRTAAPDWLPAWLRWRVAGDALAVADPGEPMIVDARPGRASLQEIRDLLLAALLDVEPWELEVMGVLTRPVEVVGHSPKPAAEPLPVLKSGPVAPAQPPSTVAPAPNTSRAIITVALCLAITLGMAWWAYGWVESDRARSLSTPVRILAQQPPPPTAISPTEPDTDTPASPSLPEPPVENAPASPEPPSPATADSPVTTPPSTAPLPAAPTTSSPDSPSPPAPVPATPATRPVQIAMSSLSTLEPGTPTAPAPPDLPPAPLVPPAPSAPASHTAAQNAMSVLHRRGDIALERRLFDEALAYYEQAVKTIGATGQNASPDSRTEAALLCRKLGTLQLQMASTAEARDTFVHGRKILLQIKKEGRWNASRARVLAELETSLRLLPRD